MIEAINLGDCKFDSISHGMCHDLKHQLIAKHNIGELHLLLIVQAWEKID
jgi:hypothetical protein